MLEDVSAIDTAVTLFGAAMPFPILLAPVAYHRLYHPDGEAASARGAAAAGATFVMSTATNTPVEEIAATGARFWLQLYLQSDRGYTGELVARAQAAGCGALCLTVDTPVADCVGCASPCNV